MQTIVVFFQKLGDTIATRSVQLMSTFPGLVFCWWINDASIFLFIFDSIVTLEMKFEENYKNCFVYWHANEDNGQIHTDNT